MPGDQSGKELGIESTRNNSISIGDFGNTVQSLSDYLILVFLAICTPVRPCNQDNRANLNKNLSNVPEID